MYVVCNNFAMSSQHTFDQCSWRRIKEFLGIYDIDMDYTKIAKLSRSTLSDAYFKGGKLSRKPFRTSFQYVLKFDEYGRYEVQADVFSGMRMMPENAWKALILKHVAQGYKNRKFYETLARLVPSKKAA